MRVDYRESGGRLVVAKDGSDTPLWIDLTEPDQAEVAGVSALGVHVPSLADMEEIEVSSRLYRDGAADVMTVVVPSRDADDVQIAAPVSFVLRPDILVTVRHYRARPFETYPARADRVGPGCSTPDRVFLGLAEEIVGRLADIMEGSGKTLDTISREVFAANDTVSEPRLSAILREIGQEGERLGRLRLSLMTLERALNFFAANLRDRLPDGERRGALKALQRDITSLGVHADHLSSRISLVTEATMGMINLAQNATVRIVSVVAALFLPPTLIASAYGMNFTNMPELTQPWGYPAALVAMLVSAVLTWAIFRWKGWL